MQSIKTPFVLFLISILGAGCAAGRCLEWETRQVPTGHCPSYLKYCSSSTTVSQQVCVRREANNQNTRTRIESSTSKREKAKRKEYYDKRTEHNIMNFEREIMLTQNQIAQINRAPRSQDNSWLNGTWCEKKDWSMKRKKGMPKLKYWHQYRLLGTKRLNYLQLSSRDDGLVFLSSSFWTTIKDEVGSKKRIRNISDNELEIWEFIPTKAKYHGSKTNTKLVRKIRKINADNFEVFSQIYYSYYNGNKKFDESFSVSGSDHSYQNIKGNSWKRYRCKFAMK